MIQSRPRSKSVHWALSWLLMVAVVQACSADVPTTTPVADLRQISGLPTSYVESLEGGLCDFGSPAIACGDHGVSLATSGGSTVWKSFTSVFFKDPNLYGQLGAAGGAVIRRGGLFAMAGEWKPLNCGGMTRNSCSDVATHESTCTSEFNNVIADAVHTAHAFGRVFSKNRADAEICWGPGNQNPGGGCEDTEIYNYPDEPPQEECDGGGGGGGGGGGDGGEGGGPICWSEYWIFEISYDDGETWEFLWEGWIEVCEEP